MAKMGKFKVTGLKEFTEKLNKLQDPDAFVESCAKELAARLLRMVVNVLLQARALTLTRPRPSKL